MLLNVKVITLPLVATVGVNGCCGTWIPLIICTACAATESGMNVWLGPSVSVTTTVELLPGVTVMCHPNTVGAPSLSDETTKPLLAISADPSVAVALPFAFMLSVPARLLSVPNASVNVIVPVLAPFVYVNVPKVCPAESVNGITTSWSILTYVGISTVAVSPALITSESGILQWYVNW